MSARRPRKKELTALRQAHNKSLFKNSFLLETFCAFAVIGTYVRKEAKEERAAGLAKRVGGHEVDCLCRGPSRGNDHVPGHEATLKLLMYSAHCRQPWGTSRANQDDDQDLAKQRREKESHRG